MPAVGYHLVAIYFGAAIAGRERGDTGGGEKAVTHPKLEELVDQMTLAEQVSILSGEDFWSVPSVLAPRELAR